VYYSETTARCEFCEEEKNNCQPLFDRELQREEMESRLVELQELSDEEFARTFIVGIGSFVLSFAGTWGVFKIIGRYFGKPPNSFFKTLAGSAGAGLAIGGPLAMLHQIMWTPSAEMAKALEQAQETEDSSLRLILVENLDEFIINLNNSLKPLL
jgi:hypothetical protein